VIAARQLVWGKLGEHDSQPSLHMADAVTVKPATVPAALAGPMPIGYLAGSPAYLVWTTGSELMVEQPGSGALIRYHFVRDAVKHPFQFPMLAGHFLVWYTGTSNTVLDLQTGIAVDIALPSSVAAAGDEIVVTRSAPGARGAVTSTTVSWIRTSPATRLDSCSRWEPRAMT
jgi:hypothetical protein